MNKRQTVTNLEKTTKAKIKQSPIDEEIGCRIFTNQISLYDLQNQRKYLAKILQPITEEAISHVKNSEYFASLINDIKLDLDDICTSLDVVSLYPNIPIDDALDQKYILLFLTPILYKLVEGAPMVVSALSPVIANFFMIYLEKKSIKRR